MGQSGCVGRPKSLAEWQNNRWVHRSTLPAQSKSPEDGLEPTEADKETCFSEINHITSRPARSRPKQMRGDMDRARAADDFPAIRARLEELRRDRESAERSDKATGSDPMQTPVSKAGKLVIAINRGAPKPRE